MSRHGPRQVTIRLLPPGEADGVAAYLRVRNAVTPESSDSADQVRWEEATYPGEIVRFLAADTGGTVVGAASTGRIWMHGPDYPRYWLGLWVTPGARRQGIGSALFAMAAEAARRAGKSGFQTELSEAQVEGHRFLAVRGFVETGRTKDVRLDLTGMAAPSVDPPPGIRITSLAAEPSLMKGVHQAAVEAFPDVPTSGEPLYAGSLEEFVARDVDREAVPREAFKVAVDEASGEVVGYASLTYAPDRRTLAYHDMTAVRPAFRGRGIASALKRATIAWAVGTGVEALETGNAEGNAPMRAVNAALGYRPLPDLISLQGPLAHALDPLAHALDPAADPRPDPAADPRPGPG